MRYRRTNPSFCLVYPQIFVVVFSVLFRRRVPAVCLSSNALLYRFVNRRDNLSPCAQEMLAFSHLFCDASAVCEMGKERRKAANLSRFSPFEKCSETARDAARLDEGPRNAGLSGTGRRLRTTTGARECWTAPGTHPQKTWHTQKHVALVPSFVVVILHSRDYVGPALSGLPV